MRQANGSPLPVGVKFQIWPRYVLSVDGIEVRLSRYRAEILLLLMSRPGRLFTTREIAQAIYWDRDDGGAWSSFSVIPTQVCGVLRACRDAGIDLRLKRPGAAHGYAFVGVGLTAQSEDGATAAEARLETSADMAVRVSRRIAQDPDAGKSPGRPRKPKTGLAVIRHPGTDGWTFPERYEREYLRQRAKDGAG